MGRIQVQFFWQEDGSTHWARATSPHAGPDRGFMFMPEVGDEVAVSFEDGYPKRPVIIGSLWNGLQQAPRQVLETAALADNNIKRLITKRGNRIQIGERWSSVNLPYCGQQAERANVGSMLPSL